MTQRFLIEKGKPYTGSTESIWDTEKDRVSWSAYLRPELGRNLTLQEFEAVHNVRYKALTTRELMEIDKEYEQTLITDPSKITKDKFNEMLNVLPPCKWSTVDGVNSFHISEHLRGNMVQWYCQFGDHFCTFVDFFNRSKKEISEKAKTLLQIVN